jgi:hypothetical protein
MSDAVNILASNVYTGLATSGTLTPDAANGETQTVTLTGNITINAFANPVAGQEIRFIFTQPAAGPTFDLSSTIPFENGIESLTPLNGAIDMVHIFFDGSRYLGRTSLALGSTEVYTAEVRIVGDDSSGSLLQVGTLGGDTLQFVGSGGTTVSVANNVVTIAGGGGSGDIVDDTTPQLGGNLDLNGFTITTSSTIAPASISLQTSNSTIVDNDITITAGKSGSSQGQINLQTNTILCDTRTTLPDTFNITTTGESLSLQAGGSSTGGTITLNAYNVSNGAVAIAGSTNGNISLTTTGTGTISLTPAGSFTSIIKNLYSTGVVNINGSSINITADSGTQVIQGDTYFQDGFTVTDNAEITGSLTRANYPNSAGVAEYNRIYVSRGTGQSGVNVNDMIFETYQGRVLLGVYNQNQILSTYGTGDLTINTNAGLNSGYLKIFDGVNGNIEIVPNGTGAIVCSDKVLRQVEFKDYAETVYNAGNVTGSFSVTVANGNTQRMRLTGSVTFTGFADAREGQTVTLFLTQDGTGGRTFSEGLDSAGRMLFAAGDKTLTATALATDVMSISYIGGTYWGSLNKNYS